jgi:hypothetical protein
MAFIERSQNSDFPSSSGKGITQAMQLADLLSGDHFCNAKQHGRNYSQVASQNAKQF